jgi:hypothetical protein
MSFTRVWLTVLALPVCGCAVSHYDGVREHWTRSERLLKELDMPLHVHATLFSPQFAAAYLKKRAQIFRLTASEQLAEERQLRDQAGSGYYFFVSATSHERNWIDFERPNSVWRIALLNDKGEQVAPSKIQLERINATVNELFPYVTEFARVYTIRFPLALPDGRPLVRSGDERLVLLFTGPLGHAELTWRSR